MNSYSAIKYNIIFRKGICKIRIGRDVRLFLIFIGSLLNQIAYTLLILAVLANAESLRRLFILKKE